MEYLMQLENPEYVRRFQVKCGVLIRERYSGSKHPTNGEIANKTTYHQHNNARQRPGENCKHKYENNNNNNNNRDIVNTSNGNGFGECVHVHSYADDNTTDVGDNSDVHVDYEIQYKSLYYLAQVGAFLGDEVFYFLFYSYFAWNLDAVVTRHIIMVWCTVMYLGQRTKDYLQWPRPPSPPVVRLEMCHLYESAMPSTHAMAGTAMPIVLATGICSRYEVHLKSVKRQKANHKERPPEYY
ncbi:sphingosine-1-phosphate phosphatase 1-like [Gigantopelta aegis]|uniref:sphingosine-1-phosphate phosphatase 1-like n=1 Tax=Gigantopelta aegis TaxID=1735272 RepID=UPI001B88B091|nr:sphingosine-1-phosphate phosphatase 1-like [Gigantopelta aegis]